MLVVVPVFLQEVAERLLDRLGESFFVLDCLFGELVSWFAIFGEEFLDVCLQRVFVSCRLWFSGVIYFLLF